MEYMKEINNKEFNTTIKNIKIPILLFFTSLNCKHCESIKTILDEIKDEEIAVFLLINDSLLNDRFHIRTVPTLLTFDKYKKPVGRFIGFKNKEFLKLQIKEMKK